MDDEDNKLHQLHDALATALLAGVQRDDAPASLIKEAREFLKDNGIQQPNPKPKSATGRLAAVLPFEEPHH